MRTGAFRITLLCEAAPQRGARNVFELSIPGNPARAERIATAISVIGSCQRLVQERSKKVESVLSNMSLEKTYALTHKCEKPLQNGSKDSATASPFTDSDKGDRVVEFFVTRRFADMPNPISLGRERPRCIVEQDRAQCQRGQDPNDLRPNT